MLVPTTTHFLPTRTNTSGADPVLTEVQREVAAFTNTFLKAYTQDMHYLLNSDPHATQHLASRTPRRWRRQVVTPDMAALQGGYTNFFRRASPAKKGKKKKGSEDGGDLPVVLVPEEDQTECVASSHLSTFGFLGFVLNIMNAVINVANNINNNDNSNNNNNNNNNNNDLNTNQAQITQTSTNTNTAMAMAGRRLEHLKQMRASVHRNLRHLHHYNDRRRKKRSPGLSSCGNEYEGDMVDEALLAAVALVDMWREVVVEPDPWIMARHVCHTAAALAATSRLASMIGQVGAAAAAHTLLNFQGVNPDFLIEAAEWGAGGGDCLLEYPACSP